ncbi:MAG TPA: pyridoxamine 5'-phosphate oxidase family protein [Pyrinomonadaceae bacterium]|nr:pyridoxamine 5'-phosphate oxidase family protein [Pyrinomonadaceae bacterium]
MTAEAKMWEKPISHGEILKKIWKNLDLGMLDRKHPFHSPTFASIDENSPSLRVVILRRFWRKPPQLAFHTHLGSPKIAQIQANPNVYWLFYHPQEKLQVRIKGTAEIHTSGELHEEQWLSTELFSRRCYVGKPPTQSSKTPTSGLPENLINREPTREESEQGKANFVVITSTIEEIDCLEMNVRGHRRSLFTWNNGELETKWLTP